MAATNDIAEFMLAGQHPSNRSNPAWWVLSHSKRQWPFWIIAAAGAISNAVLASIGPILIGQAFSAVLATPAQVEKLGGIAILAIITQGDRGLLQLACNFDFGIIAQRNDS